MSVPTATSAEPVVYLDTSALAKRYLNEDGSDAFDALLIREGRSWISLLTVVEMRCLIARRVRTAEIDADTGVRVLAAFEEDLLAGVFAVHRLAEPDFWDAFRLVGEMQALAFRTLDALHLASALAVGATELATAGRGLARAAESHLPRRSVLTPPWQVSLR